MSPVSETKVGACGGSLPDNLSRTNLILMTSLEHLRAPLTFAPNYIPHTSLVCSSTSILSLLVHVVLFPV